MTDAWGRRFFSRRNLRFAGKVGLAALSHYGDNKEASKDEATYKKLLHSMVNQLNEDMGEEKARIFITDLADMSEMLHDSQINTETSNQAVTEDSELDEKTLRLLADF